MLSPYAYSPIVVRNQTVHRPTGPVTYDRVRLIVVRDGEAILFSEFGWKRVGPGGVALLAATPLRASEPEHHITVTTIHLDTDYAIDQVLWQHVVRLRAQLNAQEFAATIYTEQAHHWLTPRSRAVCATGLPWGTRSRERRRNPGG